MQTKALLWILPFILIASASALNYTGYQDAVPSCDNLCPYTKYSLAGLNDNNYSVGNNSAYYSLPAPGDGYLFYQFPANYTFSQMGFWNISDGSGTSEPYNISINVSGTEVYSLLEINATGARSYNINLTFPATTGDKVSIKATTSLSSIQFYLTEWFVYYGPSFGAIFELPTPEDSVTNSTQVNINVSCFPEGNVYLWFGNTTSPSDLVINNVSAPANWTTNVTTIGKYYYIASCWNASLGFSGNSSLRSWTFDNSTPDIMIETGNEFNEFNESERNQYDDKLYLNMTFTDETGLFAYELNISKNGIVYYNETNVSIAGILQYNLTRDINISTWDVGTYQINISVSDSHTKKQIKDYTITKENRKLYFKTEEGNTIKLDFNDDVITDAEKKKDRYTFILDFPDGKTKDRIITLSSDKEITYLPSSSYKGHFVIYNGGKGNWIDFQGYEGIPLVSQISKTEYEIEFLYLPPHIEFNSIGGLNLVNRSYSWYRGNRTLTTPLATGGETTTLSLNLTFDEVSQNSLTAELMYNNSLLSGTTTTEYGTSVIFSNTFLVPDVNESLPLNWSFEVVQNHTTYDGNFSGYQSILEYGIGACNGTSIFPILNMSYFDEILNTPITAANGVNLTFDTGQTKYNVLVNFSGNTYDEICTAIDPAVATINLQYTGTITLEKTDYATRVIVIPEKYNFIASNNPVMNRSLYLIKIANSSTITFTWSTSEFQLIDGVMRIDRCELDGSQTMVDSTRISNGQATANLQLFTTPYSYTIVTDDGDIYTDPSFTSCHVESLTEREFFIDKTETTILPVVGLFFVDCIIKNVSADVVNMVWESNQQDLTSIKGCIVAYQESAAGRSEIYRNCTSGVTGNFTRTITNDGRLYYVIGELLQNGKKGYCKGTIAFNTSTPEKDILGLDAIFATALLVVAFILFFAADGEKQLLGAAIGIVISVIIGIFILPWQALMALLLFLGILAWVGRYSKKRLTE